MIKIEALTVQFGGIKPLDALDAQFAAPICGLIGPNGAGKTTLLNVLSGFVAPIRGTILLDDTLLLKLSPRRRVGIGLRRTFQQELVVDQLTAMENIQAVADHVSGTAPVHAAKSGWRLTLSVWASGAIRLAGSSIYLNAAWWRSPRL